MKKREFHEIELTIISMEEEDVIRTSDEDIRKSDEVILGSDNIDWK